MQYIYTYYIIYITNILSGNQRSLQELTRQKEDHLRSCTTATERRVCHVELGGTNERSSCARFGSKSTASDLDCGIFMNIWKNCIAFWDMHKRGSTMIHVLTDLVA